MSTKYCCATCFGDPGLSRSILPKVVADRLEGAGIGNCGYCGTTSTPVVLPGELSEWFEMVVDCYVPDSGGKPLSALLRSDWSLFSHPKMDDPRAKELLADILDDGEIVRKSFSPTEMMTHETPQRWDELRDEMMHRNRWFLDQPLDLERLKKLLGLLVTPAESFSGITQSWYRARLMSDEELFPLEKMGAPPEHRAGHGRANPAGIRYLYLGSTPNTAVSEVRPHTGESACVATFEVPPITVVDLRDPRGSTSPFLLGSAEEISDLRNGLPLLERLGEELTKPVKPQSSAFEYIPSQYLCEFIKKCGFEGVLYRSAMGDGVNLAMFDPGKAQGISVQEVSISRVSVSIGLDSIAT